MVLPNKARVYRRRPPTELERKSLNIDDGNPRTHSRKQIRQIAESIKQFGFNNPVLINDRNQIVAGHGRVEAAKLLELVEVPTLRLSHLSEADLRAYVIADNKLAEQAGWDREVLAEEVQCLIELNYNVKVILCLDDMHNVQADSFEADRVKVLGSWDSALPSRLRSAEHGLFILSMQRTAENDLIGHILAHEFSGIHVCLPYEFEKAHPYLFMRDLTDAQRKFCGAHLDKPVIRQTDSSDGKDIGPRLGEVWEDTRQEGDVLWPEMWPKDKVAERTKTTPAHQKAGQYQQRPTAAEGSMFKREWFDTRLRVPDRDFFIEEKNLHLCRAWDLAWTEPAPGKDPDWTVGVLMGVDANDIYYILDVKRFRCSPAKLVAEIQKTAESDGESCAIRIPHEPAAGPFVSHYLAKNLAGYNVVVERERRSKAERAVPMVAAFENKFMILVEAAWNKLFIEELCAFRPDDTHKNDDQVDAAAAAFRTLVNRLHWSFVGAGTSSSSADRPAIGATCDVSDLPIEHQHLPKRQAK